jgi:glycosyltransferase involved in cell wall biosynthesis
MRILLVHNYYKSFGGEDAVFNEEASLLEDRGITIRRFSASSTEINSSLGRLSAGLGLIYNPAARRRLRKAISDFSPEIVHVHNFFPLLSPSIFDACREANVASVLTLHNFRILCPGALLYADEVLRERSLQNSCWWTVQKRVYRNSWIATLALAGMVEYHKRVRTWATKVDRFVALSEWSRNKFVSGGLPPDRISVKPNAVSYCTVPTQSSRQGALFVGRLDEQKGLKILLEAWQHLSVPLRIIGEGPLSEHVKESSSPHITYLGRQTREIVEHEMLRAKFLVFPSIGHEMCPLTIIEAFARHLPVICSDLPSIRVLVKAGQTGLTFRPADPGSLRRVVQLADMDAEGLKRIADRAYTAYEKRYSPDANFSQLMRIYAAAMQRKRLLRPTTDLHQSTLMPKRDGIHDDPGAGVKQCRGTY